MFHTITLLRGFKENENIELAASTEMITRDDERLLMEPDEEGFIIVLKENVSLSEQQIELVGRLHVYVRRRTSCLLARSYEWPGN